MPLSSDQKKLIPHMLEQLTTPSKNLSKWEEDFIASIAEQFESRHSLSDRQYEILERIYAEKTD